MYLSNEQLKGNEITYSTDIWSFGCIIYYLYEKQSPFNDNSIELIKQNIINKEYKHLNNNLQDLLNKIFNNNINISEILLLLNKNKNEYNYKYNPLLLTNYMFKNDVYKEICNKKDIIEDYINIYNKNFDSNIVYLYINLTFINPIIHNEYMYHFNYDWKDIDFKLSVNAKENYELDLEGIIKII